MVDYFEDNNSFYGNTFSRVKDDKHIAFWYSKWVGNQSLKEAYLDLFASAVDPFYSVADAGQWEFGVWSWFSQGRLNRNVGGSWLGEYCRI